MYRVRVDPPEAAPRVGQAIDRMLRNTDAETRSQSLSAFLLGFVSMVGNVRSIILLISSAVSFATRLIVANTVAMAIRERVSEAAAMRVLGFRAVHIFGLFVGEFLILTVGWGSQEWQLPSSFRFDVRSRAGPPPLKHTLRLIPARG
jgi:putative ABC transport system permease protein